MNQYNPYVYNPYQYNPYQNQLNGYYNQQFQQMPQQAQPRQEQQMPVGLKGRFVSDPKEIAANEVPMDGSIGYFPTSDQQYIYAKAWNADGKIETGIYKLVQSEEVQQVNPMMDSINERFDRIEKLLSQNKTPVRKKVEADAE